MPDRPRLRRGVLTLVVAGYAGYVLYPRFELSAAGVRSPAMAGTSDLLADTGAINHNRDGGLTREERLREADHEGADDMTADEMGRTRRSDDDTHGRRLYLPVAGRPPQVLLLDEPASGLEPRR